MASNITDERITDNGLQIYVDDYRPPPKQKRPEPQPRQEHRITIKKKDLSQTIDPKKVPASLIDFAANSQDPVRSNTNNNSNNIHAQIQMISNKSRQNYNQTEKKSSISGLDPLYKKVEKRMQES